MLSQSADLSLARKVNSPAWLRLCITGRRSQVRPALDQYTTNHSEYSVGPDTSDAGGAGQGAAGRSVLDSVVVVVDVVVGEVVEDSLLKVVPANKILLWSAE